MKILQDLSENEPTQFDCEDNDRDCSGAATKAQQWQIEGTLAKAERDAIIAALDHCGCRYDAAAARLGIGRSTIYRLVRKYVIEISIGGENDVTDVSENAVFAAQQPSSKLIRPPVVAENQSKIVFKDGKWLLVSASYQSAP